MALLKSWNRTRQYNSYNSATHASRRLPTGDPPAMMLRKDRKLTGFVKTLSAPCEMKCSKSTSSALPVTPMIQPLNPSLRI